MTHDFFWKLVDPKKQAKQAAASASGAYAAELGYDIPAPPPHLPRTSPAPSTIPAAAPSSGERRLEHEP
jgi:hypothetical protein